MIGIYKITSPTKKVYIGQSVNIEKRWREHRILKPRSNTKLSASILKYGHQNHIFEVLCECSVEELNDKERYYQDLYSCVGKNGLNLTLTKSTDRSGYYSPEIKKNKKKGYKLSNETKEKMRIAHLGKKRKPLSDETKSKISKALKGYKHSEKSLKNMRNGKIGMRWSEERKLKQSIRIKEGIRSGIYKIPTRKK